MTNDPEPTLTSADAERLREWLRQLDVIEQFALLQWIAAECKRLMRLAREQQR